MCIGGDPTSSQATLTTAPEVPFFSSSPNQEDRGTGGARELMAAVHSEGDRGYCGTADLRPLKSLVAQVPKPPHPRPAAPESGGPVSCTDVGSLPSVAPGILDAQHTRTLISSRDLTGTHVKGQEKDFGPRISDGEAEA